jgi:predicted nucleotide-binding protein
MEKIKDYENKKLSSEAIRKVNNTFISQCDSEARKSERYYLRITNNHETLYYNYPDEFFADYGGAQKYTFANETKDASIRITGSLGSIEAGVKFAKKSSIENVFYNLEKEMEFVEQNTESTLSRNNLSKTKHYNKIKFGQRTLNMAYSKFLNTLPNDLLNKDPSDVQISLGNDTWTFNTIEEFFADYAKADQYVLRDYTDSAKYVFVINGDNDGLTVTVKLSNRSDIESVFNVFEGNLSDNILKPQKEVIKIFIGHGHNTQWKDLKDHLQDEHGLQVQAYEIGPRAGYSVKEILGSMLKSSSFACLVLTGEDIDQEGQFHARENVIHELGLFQGRLGFNRAVACVEEGVTEFSNIKGIHQIRFRKGGIKETYGDILATLKREFDQFSQ